MNLVIVESPTKAKTISQFLKGDYKVESSYGHVRDLPKSKLGIEIEKNFQPHYVIPRKAQKTVNRLKREAVLAKEIILATDEDREGEAIAWHINEILNSPSNTKRIVFHEITEKAVEEALKNPRGLDLALINAQQARRILDRLVGYKLSPFLWQKIASRLSAGRVQSVALRLIAERENEVRSFKPEEYWTVTAKFSAKGGSPPEADAPWEHASGGKEGFEAELTKINGQPIPKPGLKSETEVKKITAAVKEEEFKISKIERKEIKRNPLPPFITSTLQQEAAKRFGYSSKKTMFLAQHLYESGFITYMRTDSFNLSQESLAQAQQWLEKNLGQNYAAAAPRIFKIKSKLAQEAHEAIRPTNAFQKAETLETEFPGAKKIYELIWRRFLASQMPQAVFDATNVEIAAGGYLFRARGVTQKFDGFLKIWLSKFVERLLPELRENDILTLLKIEAEKHLTEPPPRYNEASLIKIFEEYGIGRPSTYAPIISVLQARNYVEKNEQRRFVPTEIGEIVNKVLTENFPEIVDVKFTAKMEDELDEIAQGKKKWHSVIEKFYEPFAERLEEKYRTVGKVTQNNQAEETNQKCEKCGRPLVIRYSRFGKFLACSGYPECKNVKSLKNNENRKSFGVCPQCGQGEVVTKRTKKGRFFYGCSRYPACPYATWQKPKK